MISWFKAVFQSLLFTRLGLMFDILCFVSLFSLQKKCLYKSVYFNCLAFILVIVDSFKFKTVLLILNRDKNLLVLEIIKFKKLNRKC